MKTLREVLNELAVISTSSSGKKQINEDARQATVQYITKMKEAFGDMENGVEADEAPADTGYGAPEDAAPEEEKTVEERLAALEEEVASLKAKLEGEEGEEAPAEKEKASKNPFA